MQTDLSTCISIYSVIVIIVCTIIVLLLSILLVLVKNTMLTKRFKSHISMVQRIRNSQWECELSSTADTV